MKHFNLPKPVFKINLVADERKNAHFSLGSDFDNNAYESSTKRDFKGVDIKVKCFQLDNPATRLPGIS